MADNKPPHPPTVHTPTAANDTLPDDLWLVSYADDDDRELTALQIAAALERGEIDANTIVWRDGMPEWKAIAEVEGLREQLRRVSHAPENLRRRQTQLGGFGPAEPRQPGAPTPTPAPLTPAALTPAASTPAALVPAAPGLSLDDDEPTVIQPSLVEGFSSAPNQVRPEPTHQRGRHPTSGNTLRIRTGEPPPVTPRAPSQDRITPTDTRRAEHWDSSPRVAAPSDPDLESLPSALLITEATAPVAHKSATPMPPAPTRGVMSRHSDPPGAASIPRATLTREPDSDKPPAPRRSNDPPRPPVPSRADENAQPESLPSDAVQSVVSTRDIEPPKRAPESERLPSVQVRDDYAEADLARQRTRPPRNRREGWVESGTPPPIGELSEAAARIALATSHPPTSPAVTPPPQTSSTGRWVGIALFGIAAVAGAFALGRRSGESAAIAPSANTPSTTVTTTQSAVATTPSSVEAAPTAAEDDVAPAPALDSAPAATATSKLPTAKSEATRAPTPSGSLATATKAETKALKPTGVSTAAASQATAPTSQAAVPASPPESDKTPETATSEAKAPSPTGAFDSAAAATALGNAAARASSCRQPGDPSGVARVTVTFTNSGSATHAIVDGPPFAGTATGGCIAATMRSATVPAFTGERVTVKKTVVIQ